MNKTYKYISTRYLIYDKEVLLSDIENVKNRLLKLFNYEIKYVILDFETSGINPHTLTPFLAAVKVYYYDYKQKKIQSTPALVFDLLDQPTKDLFIFFFTTLLTREYDSDKPTPIIAGHNLKYDLQVLYRVDNIFTKLVTPHTNTIKYVDTMIVSQVLNRGSKESNSLNAVVKRELDIDLDKGQQMSFTKIKSNDYLFTESQVEYAALDVEYIVPTYQSMLKKMNTQMFSYLLNVEHKLVPILASLEYKGMNFDKKKWGVNLDESEKELLIIEDNLDSELGELGEIVPQRFYEIGRQINMFSSEPTTIIIKNEDAFNYNSPKQLKELYLKYAGEYDIPKDKDGNFTTGRESLERYIRDNKGSRLHNFTKLLLEQRKWKKRISSFGENFLEMTKTTGRIHTSYRQNGTSTGRFSSGDSKNGFPNMSQIPRDNKYRTCFLGDEGYKVMTVDLGQAELRILASESKDEKMMELIRENDLHSYLATKAMTRLKGEEFIVSKTQNADIRTKFKNVNFGLIYGATSYRISELLDISLEDAEIVYGVIKEEIPSAINFLTSKGDEAVTTGKVTISKRDGTYRLFDVDNKFESSIRREAMNAPIQGINAHMIKRAMVEIDAFLYNNNNRFGDILLQVYDELVIQIIDDKFFEERVETIDKLLKKVCNLYLDSNIEMETEYQIGTTWVK